MPRSAPAPAHTEGPAERARRGRVTPAPQLAVSPGKRHLEAAIRPAVVAKVASGVRVAAHRVQPVRRVLPMEVVRREPVVPAATQGKTGARSGTAAIRPWSA